MATEWTVTDIASHTMPLRALLEWFALALFLASWIGYERYHLRRTRLTPATTRHGCLLARQVRWVAAMTAREEPILFIQAFRNLGQQSSFLGSLTLLGLGGAFSLLLSGERLRTLCQITCIFGHPSPLLAQLKILLLIAVLAFAFLQFVWAIRALLAAHLFIDGAATEQRERVAGLTRYLADFQIDFRHGLRTAYYAVCLLIWPFSVETFIVAILVLTVMLARYDLHGQGEGADGAA